MIYCNDPKERFELIGVTNYRNRIVKIENASFVIEQGFIDHVQEKANIYTILKDKKNF